MVSLSNVRIQPLDTQALVLLGAVSRLCARCHGEEKGVLGYRISLGFFLKPYKDVGWGGRWGVISSLHQGH